MNQRERNLLILLGTALFVVANLAGYKWLVGYRDSVGKQTKEYEATIEVARFAREQADAVSGEVDWLAGNMPEEKEGELMQTQLQSFVSGRASAAGLGVSKEDIQENATDGVYFERARFRINVSGTEQALYGWLTEIHSPKDFRAVTSLRLSPNREDDTKIDAVVQVEQWFPPKASEEL
jgi:hypothetical protein